MPGRDNDRAVAAADLLWRARQTGPIDTLPETCRPRDEADAYAIQDAIAAHHGPIAGWKVGAASPAATPNCAPLLAGTLYPSPSGFDPSLCRLRGVEAEIAVRLADDLPPRRDPYGRDEVLAAIETAFPVIEVCESRFQDLSAADDLSKLADSNSNAALVLGGDWAGWADLDAESQPVTLLFDDSVEVEQRGGNTAGDPRRLLVWLANHLSLRGHGLAAGQVVTTGSWTGLRFAAPGSRVTAVFPGIGEAVVSF